MKIVPKGTPLILFSSAGTYPLPLVIVNSISNFTDGSILQITKSEFKTWKAEVNLPKSPAVSLSWPETDITTVSESVPSICCLKRTCFKFNIISVTSSTTPLSVENSWSAPSIRIDEIANPSKEESKIRRNELPTVIP